MKQHGSRRKNRRTMKQINQDKDRAHQKSKGEGRYTFTQQNGYVAVCGVVQCGVVQCVLRIQW